MPFVGNYVLCNFIQRDSKRQWNTSAAFQACHMFSKAFTRCMDVALSTPPHVTAMARTGLRVGGRWVTVAAGRFQVS